MIGTLFLGAQKYHSGGWSWTGCGPDPAGMDAGLQGGAFARQAGRGRDDFAGRAFGRAADRTAGIAVDGFGVDGAARPGRSLDSIFAVFAVSVSVSRSYVSPFSRALPFLSRHRC